MDTSSNMEWISSNKCVDSALKQYIENSCDDKLCTLCPKCKSNEITTTILCEQIAKVIISSIEKFKSGSPERGIHQLRSYQKCISKIPSKNKMTVNKYVSFSFNSSFFSP